MSIGKKSSKGSVHMYYNVFTSPQGLVEDDLEVKEPNSKTVKQSSKTLRKYTKTQKISMDTRFSPNDEPNSNTPSPSDGSNNTPKSEKT
jgi:hypothetical protein